MAIFDFLINRPFLLLAVMALPLFGLAYFRQIYPSQRLLWLVLAPTLLSLGSIFAVASVGYVLAIDAVLIVIAAGDLLLVVRADRFAADRQIVHIASLGKLHRAELRLSNRSNRTVQIRLKDDWPQQFAPSVAEFQYQLAGRSQAEFGYQFSSTARGRFELQCIHLRVSSRLGLWGAFYQIPADSVVHVYPDMQQISQYDLLARTDRLNLMGVRRSRLLGQDNEFERLRDYALDDNHRHIDWRASARRRKLTVRDFQSNQSQRIVFLVDCGRMMTSASGQISFLDHAFNAMLMLSYVALRQGDRVGLVCFSDTIHSYTPPRGGVHHINRLLHNSFDKHPAFVESRYDHAFFYLRTHCLKRSLVVLITNVIDEINAQQIHRYLRSLVGRHLPLGILLRDHQLFDPIDNHNLVQQQPYQAAAAAEIVCWRHQIITDLKHAGVLALDVFPEQLTPQLVNQYLQIKARHLL